MEKAFGMIVDKVGSVLKEQGFRQAKQPTQEEEGQSMLFAGDVIAYSILYQEAKKRFELRTCDMNGETPDGKWKSISMWLYDPETDEIGQVQSIIDDFVETLEGPKRLAATRAKKKRKSDDDTNVDPLFFFNRFVGVFPELKDEITREKAAYGDVRGVAFARGNLLPKLDALCSSGDDTAAVSRSCTLLNEMYENGDMDVRSIITIVLLNGLSEKAVENLKPLLSVELEKGFKAGLKLKGKKIRPEKQQKRKSFMAETLNEMNK